MPYGSAAHKELEVFVDMAEHSILHINSTQPWSMPDPHELSAFTRLRELRGRGKPVS